MAHIEKLALATRFSGRSAKTIAHMHVGLLARASSGQTPGKPRPPPRHFCLGVRTPVAVAIDCALWLAFPAARVAPAEATATDHRCFAARILVDFLLPVFDASGATVANVANTGARVDRLRAWLAELRSSCGHCGVPLAAQPAAGEECEVDASNKPAAAFVCGKCKQVRYCSRACQQSDWKERHRAGCLAVSESLAGEVLWQALAVA